MQIKPVTLKAFEFVLTENGLRDAIANPQVITPKFKAALNGAYDDEASPHLDGNGHKIDDSHPFRYGDKVIKRRKPRKSLADLKAKAASIGKPARTYECKQCQAKFDTRAALEVHKREDHQPN